MTTPEQPYFVVRVTRCGECPHEQFYCDLVGGRLGVEVLMQNENGITPSCPMWPQRVEPPKD